MLRIPYNLNLDISNKNSRFFKVLLKKSFEFGLNKTDGIIAFILSLMLLSIEVDPIPEKQSYERDALKTYGTNHVKIVLVLLTKVVAFYIRATIVQVKVLSVMRYILKCGICFIMFSTLSKQF